MGCAADDAFDAALRASDIAWVFRARGGSTITMMSARSATTLGGSTRTEIRQSRDFRYSVIATRNKQTWMTLKN